VTTVAMSRPGSRCSSSRDRSLDADEEIDHAHTAIVVTSRACPLPLQTPPSIHRRSWCCHRRSERARDHIELGLALRDRVNWRGSWRTCGGQSAAVAFTRRLAGEFACVHHRRHPVHRRTRDHRCNLCRRQHRRRHMDDRGMWRPGFFRRRVGAILQALIAREPVERCPTIRAWLLTASYRRS
jgi:hypothetical protein